MLASPEQPVFDLSDAIYANRYSQAPPNAADHKCAYNKVSVFRSIRPIESGLILFRILVPISLALQEMTVHLLHENRNQRWHCSLHRSAKRCRHGCNLEGVPFDFGKA